ncbi:MAG: hypothetical protein Q9174_001035 [Haloplaca sp. 1 TL-2023]
MPVHPNMHLAVQHLAKFMEENHKTIKERVNDPEQLRRALLMVHANLTQSKLVQSINEKVTKADLTSTFLLRFLFPLVVVVLGFHFFLAFLRPWKYYRNDARYVDNELEYEYLTDSEDDFRPATRGRMSIMEGPLSPEEVSRLRGLVLLEEKASASGAGRKRKAGEADALADDGSLSSRSRKIKLDTGDASEDGWVSDESWDTNPFDEDADADSISGMSEIGCFYPFTFRSQHPDRTIKSAVGYRKSFI